MTNKRFTNKVQLGLLLGICAFLTIWVLLFKLCIPGRIHFNDIQVMTVEQWFWFGLNPSKSWPVFCDTTELLWQYISEQVVNLLVLVPFGCLAPFVLKKRWCFLTGLLLIFAIEFTQLFARIGGFDVIDVAANMLGVGIGVLLHHFWLGRLPSPTINKICKICLFVFVPVAAFALCSIIFIFPTTLP